MMNRQWQAIALVGTLLAVGCGGPTPPPPTASGIQPGTEAAPASRKPAPRAPASIQQAEKLSRAAQEAVIAGNWGAADSITSQMAALSPVLSGDKVPTADLSNYETAVSALATAVNKKQQWPAAIAANDAERSSVQMTKPFSPTVPIPVQLMDVDTRGVVYHAEAGKWSDANDAVTVLKKQYSSVEGTVKSRNPTLDAQVTKQINDLDKAVVAKDKNAVQTAATALDQSVKQVESLYGQQ